MEFGSVGSEGSEKPYWAASARQGTTPLGALSATRSSAVPSWSRVASSAAAAFPSVAILSSMAARLRAIAGSTGASAGGVGKARAWSWVATVLAVPAGFNRADWRSASDWAGSRLRLSASGDGVRLRSTSMPPAATPGSSEPWPPRPERTAAPGSSGAAVKPFRVARAYLCCQRRKHSQTLACSSGGGSQRWCRHRRRRVIAGTCWQGYGGLLFAGGSVAALLAHTLLSIEGRLLPGICAALLLTLDAERGRFTPKAFERSTRVPELPPGLGRPKIVAASSSRGLAFGFKSPVKRWGGRLWAGDGPKPPQFVRVEACAPLGHPQALSVS